MKARGGTTSSPRGEQLFKRNRAMDLVAMPRALIASMIFAEMRQHFPDQVRPRMAA
jgi:hypothetical protein